MYKPTLLAFATSEIHDIVGITASAPEPGSLASVGSTLLLILRRLRKAGEN